MNGEFIIFLFIATICLVTAVGMVVSTNPVHSGIFLVLCFIHVAGIFVMLGADFLGVIQIIVYTGAVLVLLLFVLMLVDPDDLPEFHEGRPIQRAVAVLLGLVLFLEVGAAILSRTITGKDEGMTPEAIAAVGGNTQAIGRQLFTDYLLPFEVISLVLTVGIIGAVVLALPERLGERSWRRRDTISIGHPRGTDLALPAGSVHGPAGEPVPGANVKPAGQGRRLVMTTDADDQPVVPLKQDR